MTYETCSINPFDNHPARFYSHSTKECPLLSDWEGKIVETPSSIKARKQECPLCLDSEILKKAQKAYRGWILFTDKSILPYILTHIESSKSDKELEEDMENF